MATCYTRNLPTDFSPRWFCPKCGSMHTSQAAARKCDASDEVPQHRVGEIVRIDIGYGWYDGDPKWLISLEGRQHHLTKGPLYAAYFVVTAIDYERDGYHPHAPRYHVKTLGIKNGNPTGLTGWNRPSTHMRMQRVPQDPVLVAEGAKFIGEKAEGLL